MDYFIKKYIIYNNDLRKTIEEIDFIHFSYVINKNKLYLFSYHIKFFYIIILILL